MTTATPPTPALERLYQGVSSLLQSKPWQDALRLQRSFYQYSFRNVCLILLQCPTASSVAGYRQWQSLGRQVKKGEKAIRILAPVTVKKKEDGDQRVMVSVRTAHVFDLSQTEGDPLPQLPTPQPLQGEAPLLQALERWTAAQGITLETTPLQGANEMFSLTENRIELKEGLSPLQRFKTLIHELAHALLHHQGYPDRNCAELEAESAAFLVCNHLGLDTSSYSFSYLAHHTASADELLTAGERAKQAASHILKCFE